MRPSPIELKAVRGIVIDSISAILASPKRVRNFASEVGPMVSALGALKFGKNENAPLNFNPSNCSNRLANSTKY